MVTLFQFLIGEIGVYTSGEGSVNKAVHHLYFMAFVFLNVWILMNVLIGILVEAYLSVKQTSGDAPTLFHEVRNLTTQAFRVLQHSAKKRPDQYVNHDELLKFLDIWLDTENKREDQRMGAKKGRRIVVDNFE